MLEEAFNNVSYMDVKELRRNFYGRLDVYTAFSDSIDYNDDGKLRRPDGIIIHRVTDVVGRKVATPYLYAHVMRTRVTRKEETDISKYYEKDFYDDIEKLIKQKWVTEDELQPIVDRFNNRGINQTWWDKLYSIVKELSNNSTTWAIILSSLGHKLIHDFKGEGYFERKSTPASLLLSNDFRYLDTIIIQKYRKEQRKRITQGIDFYQRINKTYLARNRVALKAVRR